MDLISNMIFYILIFSSVYIQVFLLVTFLENRKKIVVRNGKIKLGSYPEVTIAVPCWNEEKTIEKTVYSLLNLNYVKDNIKIFLIDDGSTDNTWEIINKFVQYPNIKIFRKKNGGKFSALNLALKHTETDFFGSFDADSFADQESLVRIMSYFEKDPSSMAVAPSLLVCNPKNIIQKAQKVEYNMGVYIKKMLGLMNAIHVTPGPLTIFRKKVFDELGPYHHAHNTEDMEIAYRMQKNFYKIEQCNDAYVYTSAPFTARKLFRQRLRWIYGFINNTFDYKSILFKKKYGDFSFFTLPAAMISIVTVSYLFGRLIYNLSNFLFSKFIQYKTLGFYFGQMPKFDFYYVNMQFFVFITIFLFSLVIFSIILGQKMADNKFKFSSDIIYFPLIYGIMAPLWVIKAIYNTLLQRRPTWR